jgi:hypothetical protein
MFSHMPDTMVTFSNRKSARKGGKISTDNGKYVILTASEPFLLPVDVNFRSQCSMHTEHIFYTPCDARKCRKCMQAHQILQLTLIIFLFFDPIRVSSDAKDVSIKQKDKNKNISFTALEGGPNRTQAQDPNAVHHVVTC